VKSSKPVSNTSLSTDKDEGGQRSNSDALASTTKLAPNLDTSPLKKIEQKMDPLPSTTPVKNPTKTKTKYAHTISRTVVSRLSVRSQSKSPVRLRPQLKSTSTSRREMYIHGVVAVDKIETNSVQPLEPSINSNDKENDGDAQHSNSDVLNLESSPGRITEQQVKKATPSSRRTRAMTMIETRKTNTIPYSTAVISQSKDKSTPVSEDEKDISSPINSTDKFLASMKA